MPERANITLACIFSAKEIEKKNTKKTKSYVIENNTYIYILLKYLLYVHTYLQPNCQVPSAEFAGGSLFGVVQESMTMAGSRLKSLGALETRWEQSIYSMEGKRRLFLFLFFSYPFLWTSPEATAQFHIAPTEFKFLFCRPRYDDYPYGV